MNIDYLAATHPDLKVLGLCHSVFWTVTTCASWSACRSTRSTFHSAGVNHQAWVLDWERDGESLYPLLDERIAADPELRRRVRVDMYRRLGYYPTETSEHSCEYVAVVPARRRRDRAAAHPGRRLPASARTTSPRSSG